MSATTPRQDAHAYGTVRLAIALARDVSKRFGRVLQERAKANKAVRVSPEEQGTREAARAEALAAELRDIWARAETLEAEWGDAFRRTLDAYLSHLDGFETTRTDMVRAMVRDFGMRPGKARETALAWESSRERRDGNGGRAEWDVLIRTQREVKDRLESLDPVIFGAAVMDGDKPQKFLADLGIRQPTLDAFALLRGKLASLREATFLGVATKGEARAFERAAETAADLRDKLLELLMVSPDYGLAALADAQKYAETRERWKKGEPTGSSYDAAAVLASVDPRGPDPWAACLGTLEHRWVHAGRVKNAGGRAALLAAREAATDLARASLAALAAGPDDLSDTTRVPFDAQAAFLAVEARHAGRYARQTRLDDADDVREMPDEREG